MLKMNKAAKYSIISIIILVAFCIVLSIILNIKKENAVKQEFEQYKLDSKEIKDDIVDDLDETLKNVLKYTDTSSSPNEFAKNMQVKINELCTKATSAKEKIKNARSKLSNCDHNRYYDSYHEYLFKCDKYVDEILETTDYLKKMWSMNPDNMKDFSASGFVNNADNLASYKSFLDLKYDLIQETEYKK